MGRATCTEKCDTCGFYDCGFDRCRCETSVMDPALYPLAHDVPAMTALVNAAGARFRRVDA